MKQKLMVLMLVLMFVVVGCAQQQAASMPFEVTRVVTQVETVEVEGEPVEVTRVVQAGAGSGATGQIAEDIPAARLIIKRGDMALIVEDTNSVVSQATALAVNAGGYLISQQVWDHEGYRYATLEMAVPVARFESALETLRTFGQVTSETASGEDVTEEYVDLESRLGNLRATQERLRELLAEAENVEEALAVNAELSRIEEELEVVLGRMAYLADRAAFSTIGLTLTPVIPTATPTVSPTPTPTLTPTPWAPGETALNAAATLGDTSRAATDGLIYFVIAWGPWLLLLTVLGLIVALVMRWLGQRRGMPVSTSGRE